MTKISIIGAGSAIFSMDLVVNLCATRSLWGSSIALMDIDQERLDAVHALAERYRDATGAELRFAKYTSRREALEGADFVVCSVMVGGYESMEAERKIAERHGYYRGIGDRVSDYHGGVGAFRQLSFFQDLARDMEALCPDALLIEAANPVFEATTLLNRTTRVRCVGVCHGHLAYRDLAEALGAPAEEVTARAVGFNHCIWLEDFHRNGENLMPRLDEWVKNEAPRYWESASYLEPAEPWKTEQTCPAAVEMYRLYGRFPIGDAVRSPAPWWFHIDRETKQRWYGPTGGFDSERGWSFYLQRNVERVKQFAKLAKNLDADLLAEFPLRRSDEQHIDIIDALVNGREVVLQLNGMNRGAIDGIPDNVAVEVPTLVNASGIHPIRVGALPPELMYNVLLPRMSKMEQVLGAYSTGSRLALVMTLMDDPRTRSFGQAQGVIDELLAQPWNRAADEHYR